MEKELPSKREGPGITPLDHRLCNHARTRTKVGQTIKIDVVQNANSVQRQRMIERRLQILVVSMIGSKTFSQTKYIIPRGRRYQDLHPHKIRCSPGTAVLLNSLLDGHGISCLKSIY